MDGRTASAQSDAVAVDAGDLSRRMDLVGKQVVVDDRVRFYQFHNGRGYDEVLLKRTDVVFRLPPRLRPENPPRPMPVVIQGRLAGESDQLICDVITIKVMPNDLDRVDQAIAGLSARDYENRKAWAAWADARGRAFKDNALLQRTRSLDEEALRLEGERKSLTVDAPKELLALAEDGRRRHIAEPEPSALAHKALQSRLAAANSSDAIERGHFLYRAPLSRGGQRPGLGPDKPGTMDPGLRERPAGCLPRLAGRSAQGASIAGSGPMPAPGCWRFRPPSIHARPSSWHRKLRRNFPIGQNLQPSC